MKASAELLNTIERATLDAINEIDEVMAIINSMRAEKWKPSHMTGILHAKCDKQLDSMIDAMFELRIKSILETLDKTIQKTAMALWGVDRIRAMLKLQDEGETKDGAQGEETEEEKPE